MYARAYKSNFGTAATHKKQICQTKWHTTGEKGKKPSDGNGEAGEKQTESEVEKVQLRSQ